jgi:queuosine precursor transporter
MERLQRASDVFCADACFVDRIDRRCAIALLFLQFSFRPQPAAMHDYNATNRCRESSHTGVPGQRPMEKTTVLQDAKRSPVGANGSRLSAVGRPEQNSGSYAMGRYKYLDTLVVAFVVVLLVSNLVAQKICQIGPFKISGGQLLFPITYIFGDVFTEVYGYAASRRAIWMGFFAMTLVSILGGIIVLLPPDPDWHDQPAFAEIFKFVPRIFAASLIGYWTGEFANSYTLSKLKLLTGGRWLWTRVIGSTVVGQAVDTTLVVVIAFWGRTSWSTMGQLILWAYLAKVIYEAVATPLTYKVVAKLKRVEGSDPFDRDEDFSPFIFSAPAAR